MTRRNYAKLFKLQHAAAKYVAINSMTAASAEVRGACGRDCCVSVDGTWQRRGHSSHHGVVSAIFTDSGKCVDAEVKSMQRLSNMGIQGPVYRSSRKVAA